MPDIIRLLPDSVANQIAAGEVVQRPASVVKELMENAVDAGATEIKLIVKDAGRTLIQVIDNGNGMSETDARLCFERHATSKITEAKDLFAIQTMGFRGEALASIAAIAHVELKAKRQDDELGTSVIIEGSNVKSQEVCSCNNGTSIAVKNIFFNVPARRNFLKSDSVETSHIIEEFTRVALAYPEISFQLYHNDKEVFQLQGGALKQRIIGIFGKNYNDRFVSIDQKVDFISIAGFIGKPEFAKKTRGEQYFFVNNRFIKHPYLHHAILNAYDELIPTSSHPSYFIFFQVNPQTIDINIHPTKTEIKFQDEKMIYAVLRSTTKLALGKSNITPTLDFEREQNLDLPSSYKNRPITPPVINVNHDYNPFKELRKITSANKSNLDHWEKLYQTETPKIESKNFETPKPVQDIIIQSQAMQQRLENDCDNENALFLNNDIFQLHNKYIVAPIKSGLMIINQQFAHERILYEHLFDLFDQKSNITQQQLFPETIELSATDAALMREISDDIKLLGFDIETMSGNTFVVNGIPALIKNPNIKELLENILENFKSSFVDLKNDRKLSLAQSMAKSMAVKSGQCLQKEEMVSLIDELFACKHPYSSPSGKPTFNTIEIEELNKKFK